MKESTTILQHILVKQPRRNNFINRLTDIQSKGHTTIYTVISLPLNDSKVSEGNCIRAYPELPCSIDFICKTNGPFSSLSRIGGTRQDKAHCHYKA